MSQLVIHVIPAIPACPVRPKSGHSANARVHHFLIVPVFFQAGPAIPRVTLRHGAVGVSRLRRRHGPGPPVGGTFWFQIFIQAPSPEIWSETISGGEEVLAGKRGGLFLGYLLGRNYRRRDRDHLVPPIITLVGGAAAAAEKASAYGLALAIQPKVFKSSPVFTSFHQFVGCC